MPSILLVSGNQQIAEDLKIILRQNCRFLTAEDASSAVRIMSSTPIDVVVVDSIQKNGEGIECINRIRKAFPDVPSIFILNDPKSSLRMQAQSLGAFACISTPFDEENFAFILEKAVERHKLENDLKYYQSRARSRMTETVAIPASLSERNIPVYHAEILRKLAKAITSVHDLDSLLLLICNAVGEIFGASTVLLFSVSSETGRMELSTAIGIDKTILKDVRFDFDSALSRWFYENNQILRKSTVETLQIDNASELLQEIKALRSEIIVPLMYQGNLLGFMGIGKRTTGALYCEDDIELLALISLYTGIALKNALDYKRINYDKVLSESILRNIRTGIISVDNEGIITGINPFAEKLLKLEAGKVIGEDIQKAGSIIADLLLRTLRSHSLYVHHEVKEAVSKMTIALSTSLLKNEKDEIIGAIAFFTDLSQIKELQSRIEYLKKAEFWSELSSRMAHEIRNPLTSIKTFTQLFKERYNEAEFRDNFVQIVGREIDKIDNITDQLVAYSRPFKGEVRAIEINTLLTETLDTFSRILVSKGITVKRETSPEVVRAKGSREMLFEAFSRVIQNSIDFAPEKSELTVSVKIITLGDLVKMPPAAVISGMIPENAEGEMLDSTHYVEIGFKDNGPGIPEENLSKILTPFFSTKVKGIGLGLAIADKTIQQHQGRIEFDSKVGTGTTVRIFLPAYHE
jgi:signal transduction histidine kinase/DNA-binding NarL/FixJ family response regulator